jgi:hypothetical protein
MQILKQNIVIENRHDARRTFKRALLVLFAMPLFMVSFVLTSLDVLGQDKWMVTPSRGGAEGARQNAQLTTLNNEFSRMNACTGVGRIYAPTHASADPNGCVTEVAGRSMAANLFVMGLTGLGTATPTQRLHVVDGYIRNSGGAGQWKGIELENTDTSRRWQLTMRTQSEAGNYDNLMIHHNDGSGWIAHHTFAKEGSVGIGTTDPQTRLDVNGAIKIAGTSETCDTPKAGAIRYNTSSQQMEFCNGTTWGSMGGNTIRVESGTSVIPDICVGGSRVNYENAFFCSGGSPAKTITFATPFESTPHVIVSPNLSADSGLLPCTGGAMDQVGTLYDNVTTTGFRAFAFMSPYGSSCGSWANYRGPIRFSWIAIGSAGGGGGGSGGESTGAGGTPVPPTCTGAGKALQWDGSSWSCADNSTGAVQGSITGGCNFGSGWGTATNCALSAGIIGCAAGHTGRPITYHSPSGHGQWNGAGTYASGFCIKD